MNVTANDNTIDFARVIREAQLEARADEYASTLLDGCEILDDTDADVIADFAHLLPGVLARRGYHLERIPGGWRVRHVGICTPQSHAALKASRAAWLSLEYVGLQDNGAGGKIELRECRHCHSSLGRTLPRLAVVP